MKWEDDTGIYDFASAKRLPRSRTLLRNTLSSHTTIPDQHRREPVSAPSISLNMAKMGSQLQLCSIAAFGVVLQSSAIVYAVLINFLPLLGSKLQKTEYPAIMYTLMMACGTVVLVVGMYLCSYSVEKSTVEESWEVKKIGGAKVRVVWLQKGGVVGDQLFNAYALFPTIPTAILRQSSTKYPVRNKSVNIRMISAVWGAVSFGCRVTGPVLRDRLLAHLTANRFRTPFAQIAKTFKGLWAKFSGGRSGICLRTSRQDSSGGQQIVNGISVLFSLEGLVCQFMGLQELHWSVTILQLGATDLEVLGAEKYDT